VAAIAVVVVATIGLVALRRDREATAAVKAMVLQPSDLGPQWSVVHEGSVPADAESSAGCQESSWHGDRGYARTMSVQNGGRRSLAVSAAFAASSPAEANAHQIYVASGSFSSCALLAAEAELSSTLSGTDVGIDGGDVTKTDLQYSAPGSLYEIRVRFHENGVSHTFVQHQFHMFAGRHESVLVFAWCDCRPLDIDEALVAGVAAQRIQGRILELPTTTTLPAATTTTGTTLPFTQTGNPCALLTADEVQNVAGDNRGPARTTTGDDAEQCSWIGVSGSGPNVVIQIGTTEEQFASRLARTDDPIHGLGDQAAGIVQFPGQMLARKGTSWVYVYVDGTSQDRAFALELTTRVLKRLG